MSTSIDNKLNVVEELYNKLIEKGIINVKGDSIIGKNGSIIKTHECIIIGIPKTILHTDNDAFSCSSLLLYGDWTLEVHDDDAEDAYTIYDVPTEEIQELIKNF